MVNATVINVSAMLCSEKCFFSKIFRLGHLQTEVKTWLLKGALKKKRLMEILKNNSKLLKISPKSLKNTCAKVYRVST